MTDTRDELVEKVREIVESEVEYGLIDDDREGLFICDAPVNDIIALVQRHRDAEIREALLSTDHEGPVHKAMSVWTVAEHLYRQNSEGEPTHEAAMAFATAAIEQALIVAGLAEKGAER